MLTDYVKHFLVLIIYALFMILMHNHGVYIFINFFLIKIERKGEKENLIFRENLIN